MDEIIKPAAAEPAAEAKTAAPAPGDAPLKKKKKKRPAPEGTVSERSSAAAEEKTAHSADAPPKKKKKKRPAPEGTVSERSSAAAEEKTAHSVDASPKKKKKRPAPEGTVSERSSAAAEEKAAHSADAPPKKKKKKRPAPEGAVSERSSAAAEEKAAHSADASPKKKKKRPAPEGTVSERSSAAAEEKAAHSADAPPKKKKKRPAPEGTVRERRPEAAARTAVRRPAAAERRSVQRPERREAAQPVRDAVKQAASRTAGAVSAKLQESRAAAKEAFAFRPFSAAMFGIFLVIYVIVLALLIRTAVKKADNYLAEYESSRPKYMIEDYISGIGDDFLSEMMTQAAAGLSFTPYEKPEMLYDSVRSQAEHAGEYTYKTAADYSDSRPSYYIMRNGQAVACAALSRAGWTERYSFPVWRVDPPVSMIELKASPSFTLDVTMPEDAVLSVNGVEVPEDQYLEAESDFVLSQTERYFMDQPMARKCVINGLYCPPQVTVTDKDGNELTPYEIPDADHADQKYVFPIADSKDPDSALIDRVTALTYAYMDYVINTRCELDANLANLSNYMIAGSPVSNLMYTIASDIWYNNDPNMREDHVFEITHVRQYAENVCTVDVHLESTIGKVAVNDYIGTVRWVMVNTGYGWYASNLSLHP